MISEGFCKCCRSLITGRKCDRCNGFIQMAKFGCSLFESDAADMLIQRLSNVCCEDAVKVVRREACDVRKRLKRKRAFNVVLNI